MSKSTAPVAPVAAFTRKAAAALYLAAPVKGREAVAARITAQSEKNQKRAWKTLVRYIASGDLVRIKLVVSGTREEWAAINADAKAAQAAAKTPAKAPAKKAAPKPKAAPKVAPKAAPKAAPVIADGVDEVAAAKAFAVLLSAGLGNSPEAALIASFLRG
jgi:hypothetical protein